MGFVLIVGQMSAELFGSVFPKCGTVTADLVKEVDAECAVILCDKCGEVNIRNALGVIFNGDSPPPLLPDGIQLISCGICAKNTVSLSSRAADSITLSLNRSIQTENGICEPLELPVKADESANVYEYMAAFAAAVLLGKICAE